MVPALQDYRRKWVMMEGERWKLTLLQNSGPAFTLEMVALVLLPYCWSNLVPCGGKSALVGRAGIHRWDLISTWYLKNMFKLSDPNVCVGIGV